jgi:hypothetical protein
MSPRIGVTQPTVAAARGGGLQPSADCGGCFGGAGGGDDRGMPNPQNPEIRRSEEILRPRPDLGPDPQDFDEGGAGPVPPDNQPGHHPERDQDQPPPDAFAEALGIRSDRDLEAEAEAEAPAKRQASAKKAGAGKAGAKKATAKKAPAKMAAAEREAGRDAGAPPAADARQAQREAMAEAARRHDHTLADRELPHDEGLVTPTGAPITVRVLTVPVRCAGLAVRSGTSVLRMGTGAAVYGVRMAYRTVQRFTPGG